MKKVYHKENNKIIPDILDYIEKSMKEIYQSC